MENKNLVSLMSRITEKAHRLIVRELEMRGIKGIVPSHGGILSLLFIGEQYTMKEIAEKIHRTKPTVTVLVDKLVELGYVVKEKSHEDSRVTFIRLTEKGVALKPSFIEVSEKLNAIVYKDLADRDIKFLQEVLGKINSHLDEGF